MSRFHVAAAIEMQSPVQFARPEDSLKSVSERMQRWVISALPILSQADELVGTISRSDLLKVGRITSFDRWHPSQIELPDQSVGEVMSRDLVTASITTPLADVARLMDEHGVHRVYIERDEHGTRKISGVISTKEMLRAICDAKLETPAEDLVVGAAVTAKHNDSLASVAKEMQKTGVSGVVILDGDIPVGIFTRLNLLEASQMSSETPIEEIMSHRYVTCLPHAPLWRAAAQALALRARRIVVVGSDKATVANISGLDFARFVSKQSQD